jgi:hypothetical protein
MAKLTNHEYGLILMGAILVGATVLAPTPTQAQTWARVFTTNALTPDGQMLCWDNFANTDDIFQYPCNFQDNQRWTWGYPGNTWVIQKGRGCLQVRDTALGTPLRLTSCLDPTGWFTWRWINELGHPFWRLELVHAGMSSERRCVQPTIGNDTSPLILGRCDGLEQGVQHEWLE